MSILGYVGRHDDRSLPLLSSICGNPGQKHACFVKVPCKDRLAHQRGLPAQCGQCLDGVFMDVHAAS